MFGLNVGRAELAGFVARKKDDATCLFCIPFEHVPSLSGPLCGLDCPSRGPLAFFRNETPAILLDAVPRVLTLAAGQKLYRPVKYFRPSYAGSEPLRGQRLGRQLGHLPSFQSKHAVAAPG